MVSVLSGGDMAAEGGTVLVALNAFADRIALKSNGLVADVCIGSSETWVGCQLTSIVGYDVGFIEVWPLMVDIWIEFLGAICGTGGDIMTTEPEVDIGGEERRDGVVFLEDLPLTVPGRLPFFFDPNALGPPTDPPIELDLFFLLTLLAEGSTSSSSSSMFMSPSGSESFLEPKRRLRLAWCGSSSSSSSSAGPLFFCVDL